MKSKTLFAVTVFLISGLLNLSASQRLVILADMGNEPDEEQQMMHMLMCSHEFELEGLIAVTGKFLHPDSPLEFKRRLYPDLFHHLIEGYSKVYEKLKKHADGWPEPDYLTSIVASGQRGYGFDDVGEGKSSEGSKLLEKILLKDDDRPIYLVVNAGSNTLAQALFDLRNRLSEEELNAAIAKLRIYENGAQDNCGAWITYHFPDVHWVRSNYQTYCYGGPSIDGGFDNKGKKKELGPHTWKPYAYSNMGQHQWLLENIIGDHGPFGNYYPIRQFHRGGISFMEGGGTIPWLCLVNKGLSDINHPDWGGWSGLFTREKVKNEWSKHQSVKVDEGAFSPFYMFTERPDTWTDEIEGITYEDNIYSPVWRWRRAFLNDFVCRMDWCVKSYEDANHHPVAAVNGDTSDDILIKEVKAGQTLKFDASASSDPDDDDLKMTWWVYPEAGTYEGAADIPRSTGAKTKFKVPADAAGSQIHLILEVEDQSKIASLYDYRRVVLNVL
ncbi:MAG: DUF1593 domain-containing protein [Opitutales bacterium]|nr:DUF1593 domain-containing protein [Opitutales bacterium]